MKTFLKLITAMTVFGFATANAEFTAAQKAAAIKVVTDAIADGDQSAIEAAVSQQVAAYPELAGDIVAAAVEMNVISDTLLNIVVQTAAYTAPSELLPIQQAINSSSRLNSSRRLQSLARLLQRTAIRASNALGAGGNGNGNGIGGGGPGLGQGNTNVPPVS